MDIVIITRDVKLSLTKVVSILLSDFRGGQGVDIPLDPLLSKWIIL